MIYDLNYISWDNAINTDNPYNAYNNVLVICVHINDKNCPYRIALHYL